MAVLNDLQANAAIHMMHTQASESYSTLHNKINDAKELLVI